MACETTAILIDSADQRRVVPKAWAVPALRPYSFRWCATCADEDCIWPGHPILTFTASRFTAQGWEYRTPLRWPDAPEHTATVAHVINNRGDVVGTMTGHTPWPDTTFWHDHRCEFWCHDAKGMVVYRLQDAD